MTAERLIDIFCWEAILYASPALHDAADRRFDALVLRRMKERLS